MSISVSTTPAAVCDTESYTFSYKRLLGVSLLILRHFPFREFWTYVNVFFQLIVCLIWHKMATLWYLCTGKQHPANDWLLFRTPRARLIALVFGVHSNLFEAIKGEHKPTLPCILGRKDSGFITALLNSNAESGWLDIHNIGYARSAANKPFIVCFCHFVIRDKNETWSQAKVAVKWREVKSSNLG
jgi:hypothetical protein